MSHEESATGPVFVVAHDKIGSGYCRGAQFTEYWSGSSYILRDDSKSWAQIAAVPETTVVFVKQLPPARWKKPPGHLWVWDTVDILCEYTFSLLSQLSSLDVIIVPTEAARLYFLNLGFTGPVRLLLHQWDPRLITATTTYQQIGRAHV